MDWKFYVERLWYKVLYGIVVIIYLVRLNDLNKEILLQHLQDDPFATVQYNDYAPLKYFGLAVILFVAGCIILYIEIRMVKEGMVDELREIVITVLTFIICLILLGLIIKFITIPILKAILMCVFLIIGGAGLAAAD